MRLICPNCGAQYEVADDVIPEAGRDVQCSNCGHTWFEHPGASEAAEEEGYDHPAVDPDDAAPEAESDYDDDFQAEPEPAPEVEPEHRPNPEPEAQQPQRAMDPEIADILREEAEYEQSARQAEADPIETQPDLDLSQDPDEDRRSREARDRLSRLRGEPEVAASVGAPLAQAADAPRRELLPDIEEINSTLRPDARTDYSEAGHEEPLRTRSGFRRGFMFIVILALIALAAYVFAPQISAAVPQTDPVLSAYVDWVDGVRIWLDGQVQGLIEGVADEAPAASIEPNPDG